MDIFQREVREAFRQVAKDTADQVTNVTNIITNGTGVVNSVTGTAPITVSPNMGDVVVGINPTGYVSSVTAGTNLSGGGTGAVTLSVIASPSFAGNVTMGDAVTDNHVVNGILNVQQLRGKVQAYTPTPSSVFTLPLDPDTTIVRINSGSESYMVGMSGGFDGRIVYIWNVGAANTLVYQEHGSATPADRLALDANTGFRYLLSQGISWGMAAYDGTSQRWRITIFENFNVGGGKTIFGDLSGTGSALFNSQIRSLTNIIADGNLTVGNAATIGNAIGDAHSLTGTLNLNGTAGTNQQIAYIDGANGPKWGAPSAAGIVDGTGTLNTVPKWTPDGNTLGNSLITDDGTTIVLATDVTATSSVNVTGNVDTASAVHTDIIRSHTSPGGAAFVTFGNAIDVNSDISKFGVTDGNIFLDAAASPSNPYLGFQYSTNSAATGWINYKGFEAGTTQFRNLVIADGKTASVVTVTGNTKQVDFAGAITAGAATLANTTVNGTLTTTGNATLGDNIGDSHTINGATTVTGALSVEGNATLGNATTDSHTANGTLNVQQLVGKKQTTSSTGIVDLTVNADITLIEFDAAATVDLVGLSGGVDGRILFLRNKSAAANVLLYEQNTNAAAANRLILSDNLTSGYLVNNGGMALAIYDGTAQRWYVSFFLGHYSPSNFETLGSLTVTTFGGNTGNLSVGNNATITGTLGVTGATTLSSLSTSGNATLGDGSADTHTLNGNITLQNSPTAGPIKYGSTQARIFLKRTIYTTANDGSPWTPTTGAKAVLLRMVGGGGGGGSKYTLNITTFGGGGAGGMYVEKWIEPGGDITSSGAVNVVVGAGGAGGNNGAGGDGTDTSINISGTTYVAKGGLGGSGNDVSTGFGAGGNSQSQTQTVDLQFQEEGGFGFYSAISGGAFVNWSGKGGSSPFGAGGDSVQTSAATRVNGKAGQGYGAGGSGSVDSAATGGIVATGGAGTDGLIILEEYA